MNEAVVYRIFDATDRLIYIGATSNVTQRLAYHRTQSWWWALAHRVDVESHEDKASAHDAEWAAIAAEDPAFNLALRRGRPSSKPIHLTDPDATPVGSPLRRMTPPAERSYRPAGVPYSNTQQRRP
jgi:excinuclease UvrABC nuclease subunit